MTEHDRDQGSPGYEETGLNLFDDRASAVGSFPQAMLGYDKRSVDNYVRDLEQHVGTLRQLTRNLRRDVAGLQRSQGTTDFTRLGAYATQILQSAEGQSEDLISQAAMEAERIKEEARRVAAELRANAQTEADDIRVSGLASLRKLRAEMDRQVRLTLEQSREEAGAALSSALRHADTVVAEAEHKAEAMLDKAHLQVEQSQQRAKREADKITLDSRNEAGDLLANARTEGQQLLAGARHEAKDTLTKAQTEAVDIVSTARKQADAITIEARETALESLAKAEAEASATEERVAGLLAASTVQHGESTKRLQDEAAEAARIRSEALTAAESAKAMAARDSEAQIAAAHRQAAMMKDRLEEQFAWRRELLERETNALTQRKEHALAQLRNLDELARQSMSDFADRDQSADLGDPAEQSDDSRQVAGSFAPMIEAEPRPDGALIVGEPTDVGDPADTSMVIDPVGGTQETWNDVDDVDGEARTVVIERPESDWS